MCKEKFVDPFTDFGFKRVFGTEKDVLIQFLNTILEDEAPIVDLEYLNVERLGTIVQNRRASFDLYCKTEDNKHIIVELQREPQAYFKERSVYYSSFAIQDSATKGKKWDFNLPHIYSISLLNFHLPPQNTKVVKKTPYKTTARLYDIETKELWTPVLTYVYLEMKKFKKTIDQLKTFEDKWMYAINNLCELDRCPEELKEETFVKFFELARIAAFTDAEKWEYESSLKEARDQSNQFSYAEARGEAKGLAKGEVLGREKEKLAIARTMKAQGFSLDTIIACTGLIPDALTALDE
ncbi:MAG: Rpn family recombination-promoting nuclease/putative transposase [Bacteroidales bacterium]|nr:Rpn family recombination-promoting nuclease/putative transposase [Bacteroidales bacterium]